MLATIREKLDLRIGQRFPLAYLMEAADDISYCLSDIEDGIENGILKHDQAVAQLDESCKNDEEARAIFRACRNDEEVFCD